MKRRCSELPQEIWYQIFEKLDERDLEELSLVSKEFLSITSSIKTSLKIVDETLPCLSSILLRFRYLESIAISVRSQNCYRDLLYQISRFGRTKLKRLSFGGFKGKDLNHEDLVVIAELFLWIEEISVTGLVSLGNCEFQNLQQKFTSLKKVSFGCINIRSNELLTSLSLNCTKLEEIDVEKCTGITQEVVGFIMRHSPNLTTLKLPSLPLPARHYRTSLCIQNSIAYAKKLHTFCLSADNISEELVDSFGEANPPLQKFHIKFYCHLLNGDIKTSNMLLLLRACSSIHHLCISGNHWISDNDVETISQYLTKLTYIDLSKCLELTAKSFFILTKNCPSLEEIKMVKVGVRDEEVFPTDLYKHEKLRYLNLSENYLLDDKTLRFLLSVCPNIISMNISRCTRLTEEVVHETLKTCGLLTVLRITNLHKVSNIFGKSFEGKTIGLKTLEAGQTTINDKTLGEIGKICTSLEFLDIRSCEQVTNTGLMEVLRNCKRLKKIFLHKCRKLEVDQLIDMVRSNPMIKQNVIRFEI